MIATAAPETALPTNLVTVEEFENWTRQPGNDGRYEFVRGHILPKPGMKQNEISIAKFLTRGFIKTRAFEQGDELIPEADSYVDSVRKRIPDLTYFSVEQQQAIRRGERVSALFAIEILSDSELHQDVLDKIQDYFDAGAQLVWYILPKNRQIEAFTSPDDRRVYKAADTISAAPVIPEFAFTVADLFA